MKVAHFIVLFQCLKLSSCCHNGDIWDHPKSTSVVVGDSAQFFCNGTGSYLHWYIDGIKTEDMTSEEIADRGISFTGNYNRFAPYVHGCEVQYSNMTMAGNCLNANSKIICIVPGTYPQKPEGGNTTSKTATFTVQGDLSVIKNLDVLQKGSDKFLVYWEVTSVNYTQSISIETVNSNTTYNATLDKSNMHYLYSPKSLDPCAKHNVAVNVMACSVDCSGSETTSTYLIGMPLQSQNTKQDPENHKLVQFQVVNSSSCPGSLPNTVTLVLLDNQGNQLQSSSAIPWDNLTVIGYEEYQMEWSFDLQDNTQYQLMIITHNSIGQATSDPFVISTFDVTSVQYSMDNTSSSSSELCITCTFTINTQAKGCLVVLLNTDTTLISGPLRISRNSSNNNTASDCITLSDNGHYILSVYDWEEDGGLSNETAVTTNIRVVGIMPIPTTSSVFEPGQCTCDLCCLWNKRSSSQLLLSEHISSVNSPAEDMTIFTVSQAFPTSIVSESKSNLGLGVIFGILFSLCLLLLLVMLISSGVLILKNKLMQHKTTTDNRDAVGGLMAIQTNSAYDAVKFSENKKDVMYEELQTINTAKDTDYEMVSISPTSSV